jgi:peptidoglycan hydrolase-like protein with peptidoglycan-binding domain
VSPADVLALQRTAGNRAVGRMLSSDALPAGSRRLARAEQPAGKPGARHWLNPGDTGPGVSLLQRILGVPRTGVFDEATRLAVVDFQTARPELHPATGGVGEGTWKALDEIIATHWRAEGKPGARPWLNPGDFGPGVELLQRALGISVTGRFDEKTRLAVVDFQVARPELLPATGGVGEGTWKALDEIIEWVKGQWSTPDFTGEQQQTVTEITKTQLNDEIARVAPQLSRPLRVCMVGHAWVEQQGKGILNYNFGGVEGGSSAWVLGWTSAAIPMSTYENEPDKSKYRDWDSKGHNPGFGKWKGHDAGTIAVQLAMDPKPDEIVVLVHKHRPAYQSLAHAAAAYVKLIERRIEALRASAADEQRALGERAFAGDADAYANIVNHSFQITDGSGQKRDFGAYNGDPGYFGLVKDSIATANTELP